MDSARLDSALQSISGLVGQLQHLQDENRQLREENKALKQDGKQQLLESQVREQELKEKNKLLEERVSELTKLLWEGTEAVAPAAKWWNGFAQRANLTAPAPDNDAGEGSGGVGPAAQTDLDIH
jgi:hypothetical protein